MKAIEVLRRTSELLDAYSVYEPEECDRAKMQRDAEALTRIITALKAATVVSCLHVERRTATLNYEDERAVELREPILKATDALCDALAALEQE
jgi:hypothetical protein